MDIINKKTAELECVITGDDKALVSAAKITWNVDGNNMLKGATEGPVMYSKTSKLTRSYSEWQNVNSVSCSAEGFKDVSETFSRGMYPHKHTERLLHWCLFPGNQSLSFRCERHKRGRACPLKHSQLT